MIQSEPKRLCGSVLSRPKNLPEIQSIGLGDRCGRSGSQEARRLSQARIRQSQYCVVPRPKKDDSAEVYIGEEFIPVRLVDDEDDDRSFQFPDGDPRGRSGRRRVRRARSWSAFASSPWLWNQTRAPRLFGPQTCRTSAGRAFYFVTKRRFGVAAACAIGKRNPSWGAEADDPRHDVTRGCYSGVIIDLGHRPARDPRGCREAAKPSRKPVRYAALVCMRQLRR